MTLRKYIKKNLLKILQYNISWKIFEIQTSYSHFMYDLKTEIIKGVAEKFIYITENSLPLHWANSVQFNNYI